MDKARILRETADIIEQNPNLYDFNVLSVPGCGEPGCVLGWIGVVAGLRPGADNIDAANLIGYHNTGCFYRGMDNVLQIDEDDWSASAKSAANCLRRLADKEEPERNFARECLDNALNGPLLIEHKVEA